MNIFNSPNTGRIMSKKEAVMELIASELQKGTNRVGLLDFIEKMSVSPLVKMQAPIELLTLKTRKTTGNK